MTPRSASQSSTGRGFTLIEVMTSLTVLGIGTLGLVSLQRAAIVSNASAQQYTVAASVAQGWLDRLKRDAASWNHPIDTADPVADISTDTLWLKSTPAPGTASTWFVPASQFAQGSSTAYAASDKFTVTGEPTTAGADTIYCVNVRLQYIYADKVIRSEVRVYWPKRGHGNLPTAYLISAPATPCATASLDTLGADDDNFHWVYAVGAIPQATAQ
jgi:prepilin-type N-terminal cleavage/methylation domain-containing protein